MLVVLLGFPGDPPLSTGLDAEMGGVIVARSADDVERRLTEGPVDALLVGPQSWARSWVVSLPADRVAVVVVGAADERLAAEADDWVTEDASPAEIAARVRVAVQRARLRRRAIRRGTVDPLTGLPNRRGVIVALLRAAARRRRENVRLSLVLVDLDHFKRVNETEGHDAGDRLLRKVGRLLMHSTRKDEFCGRIGGDEFAIVVAGDTSQAELVGRRVQLALLAEHIACTFAGQELGAHEGLRELYHRVDVQLRGRKRLRPYANIGGEATRRVVRN